MLKKFNELLYKSQRGAFMVFFALLVPIFLTMIGFAVDAGNIYMQKAKMQDIADAAALAGAGHLNESASNVRLAVSAYAASNGLKAEGTSDNNVYMGDRVNENDVEALKSANIKDWKLAQAIDTMQTDKDYTDEHSHVRVVIAKRVPTFFINILFKFVGDTTFEDSVVVRAKAVADYVKGGEVPVEQSGIPGLISYEGPLMFYSSGVYGSSGKGIYTDLYTNSGIMLNEKMDLYGSYYSNNEFWQLNICGDKNKNMYKPFWWEQYGSDEQKKDIITVKNDIKTLRETCENYIRNANITDYKEGRGNKVYIDRFGIYPKSIKIDPGKEYDVYIDASNMTTDPDKDEYGDSLSIVCNRYLHGIKKINNLIVDTLSTQSAILNTEGITYNNVYLKVGSFIEGKNNYFKGTVFNENMVCFMGEENHFSTVISHTIKIGYGYHFDTKREGAASSNWKCYFGSSSGSGSSGSDDSSSGTQAHVRLVE